MHAVSSPSFKHDSEHSYQACTQCIHGLHAQVIKADMNDLNAAPSFVQTVHVQLCTAMLTHLVLCLAGQAGMGFCLSAAHSPFRPFGVPAGENHPSGYCLD